ncbi:hypothetical protein, partial [Streptomyces mirabilis]|uniref:hypothetical protein n=1 Tax=Streptomyces mirabilis TaxID=68239 RepID=UPI0036CC2CE3
MVGQVGDGEAFFEVEQGPFTSVGERGGLGGGEAPVDVLGLSAVAVGGGDDVPGDVVRDGCAEVFADQVQTQVDAGRESRGGQDGVFFYFEDVEVLGIVVV